MNNNTVLALPATLGEIQGLAEAFVKSGMFTDIKDMAQAVVKIQAGKELGLQPIFSMQNIVIISNKLSMSARAMAYLVKASGRYTYKVTESDDTHCNITFFERSGSEWMEIGKSSFSVDDAKRAGLTRNPTWSTYPGDMCFSRAISQGARKHCPDAIGGAYTTEELENIDPPKAPKVVVTPSSVKVTEVKPAETEPMSDKEAAEIFEKTEPSPAKKKAAPEPEGTSDSDLAIFITEAVKKIGWGINSFTQYLKDHRTDIGYTELPDGTTPAVMASKLTPPQQDVLCRLLQGILDVRGK